MRLKFPENQIANWAKRYSYSQDDGAIEKLKEKIAISGCLTKDDLWVVARWKAPRSAGNILKNEEAYVCEITNFALTAREERSRIESLTLLSGVGFPSASVILHLYHSDPYPIIDYRALWSLGASPPTQYSFDFWWQYVQCCRDISDRCSLDMRTLDRSLWQFSKENQ